MPRQEPYRAFTEEIRRGAKGQAEFLILSRITPYPTHHTRPLDNCPTLKGPFGGTIQRVEMARGKSAFRFKLLRVGVDVL